MTASVSDEDNSKDAFFEKLAELSQEMINAHGKEFSMGALVLEARFIVEEKPLKQSSNSWQLTVRSCIQLFR